MYNMLKKGLIAFLIGLLLFGSLTGSASLVSANQNDVYEYRGHSYRRSEDVPAVYITGANHVRVDRYVSCSIVVVDAIAGTRKSVVDEDAEIRIRGNSTSSGDKKPFNIKFATKTDLLGMGKGRRYCLIANLYDPTLLRNQMVFDFAREIGMQNTPDSELVDVYFDGRYLGCYQLCEALTEGEDRVDIHCEAGDFLLERDERTDPGTSYFVSSLGIRFGVNEPSPTGAKQFQEIQQLVRAAEQALVSNRYAEVRKYFDIPSMIDAYICLEYFKNVDIDCASTRFYYQNGKFYGGPVWDYDLSTGNCSSTYYESYNNYGGDSATGIYCNCLWFRYLLRYKEFYRALQNRYLELQDQIVHLYADTVLGQNYLDRTIEHAATSIRRNFSEARWSVGRVYAPYMRIPNTTYELNVKYLRDWLRRRNAWLLEKWNLTARLYPMSVDPSIFYVGDYLIGFPPYLSTKELDALFTGTVSCRLQGMHLATGDSLRTQGASRTVIVSGDINGDGRINAVDYMMMRRIADGSYEPSETAYLAACLGGTELLPDGSEKMKQYCTQGIPYWKIGDHET